MKATDQCQSAILFEGTVDNTIEPLPPGQEFCVNGGQCVGTSHNNLDDRIFFCDCGTNELTGEKFFGKHCEKVEPTEPIPSTPVDEETLAVFRDGWKNLDGSPVPDSAWALNEPRGCTIRHEQDEYPIVQSHAVMDRNKNGLDDKTSFDANRIFQGVYECCIATTCFGESITGPRGGRFGAPPVEEEQVSHVSSLQHDLNICCVSHFTPSLTV